MSDPLVKRWLEAGEFDLPLPGSGQTANAGASWPRSPKSI
jgi:hypothetical protein